MNVYVGTNSLKNAYIGKVIEKVIECDFTEDYHGVTYYGNSTAGKVNYGRDENGLYGICNDMSGNYRQGLAWNIPSAIYSQGVPKKITLTLRGGYAGHGGGLATGIDTKVYRAWGSPSDLIAWGWQTYSTGSLTETTPVDTDYKMIIDLENKEFYMSISSTKLAITDSGLSAFTTDWNAGNVHLVIMLWGVQNATAKKGWLKKLTLEY